MHNVFIKTDTIKTKTFKLINSLTDHYPLFISLNRIKTFTAMESKTSINYDKLVKVAKEVNWDTIFFMQDPTEGSNTLIESIKNCVSLATVNIKIRNKRDDTKPRNKWITKVIIVSCNRKELLYEIQQKDIGNDRLKNDYKKYTKILNKVITEAKIKFDGEQMEKNQKNPRNLWKIIKTELG